MNNVTKTAESPATTKAEPAKFSFSRVFDRNGKEQPAAPETKPKGPAKISGPRVL